MSRTLIQEYTTRVIQGMTAQAHSIGRMNHKFLKGRFRELFVASVLDRFLTSQFGIGSGIIVNQRGDQSTETDIIIFDNRILPPFIREERLGVFPVEAVVATIEVKSILNCTEIKKSQKAAQRLEHIRTTGSIYDPADWAGKLAKPMKSIVGLNKGSIGELAVEGPGAKWLAENAPDLTAICLIEEFSWLRRGLDGWSIQRGNSVSEETKRFIGVLIDNVRTTAEHNYRILCGDGHRDFVGVYIRHNPSVQRVLHSQESASGDEVKKVRRRK